MDTPFLPGRYRVIRTLGEGGVGRVLLAQDTQLDRRVAIKLLAPIDPATEDDWARRLVEEARVLSRLHHPSIVALYDMGRLDTGRPYLVFELVEGTDLAHVLEKEAPLDYAATCGFLVPVLEALGHAHELGVVHRDVKPANILVRGGTRQPLLADFGCARTAARTIKTQTGIVLGTPGYVAPEVLSGEQPVPASDLYAIGCILHEALLGRPPFQAGSAGELLIAHLRQELAPTDLARPVDRVLRQALAKKPLDRHADAAAMIAALRTAGEEVARGPASRDQTLDVDRPRRTTDRVKRMPSASRGALPGPRSEPAARPLFPPRLLLGAAGVVVALLVATGVALKMRAGGVIVRPVITLNTRGRLTAAWETPRPMRCAVTAIGPEVERGKRERLSQAEEREVESHAVVLEGLFAPRHYDVEIIEVDGDRLFSGPIDTPDGGEIEVQDRGHGLTGVTVSWAGTMESCELTRPGEEPLAPAARTARTAEFVLPVVRSLVPDGTQVRLSDARGVKLVLPVPGGREVVRGIVAGFQPAKLELAVRRLTRPPVYDNGQASPACSNRGKAASIPYPLRARLVRQKTGLGEGTYAKLVADAFRELPQAGELWAMRAHLPAFFASPAVPPAEKLALYHVLLELEWLDRLCTSQFEVPVLSVRRWYEPLVAMDHELLQEPSPFPKSCPVISAGRGFVTTDFEFTDSELTLLPLHPAFKRFRIGSARDRASLAAYSAPLERDPAAFETEALAAGMKNRTGTAELRAQVALLSPTHVFELTFVGTSSPGKLVVVLSQPGTPEWRQAMDQLTPDTGEYVAVMKRFPSGLLYGEIRATFPAGLLPPGPLRMKVRYRHAPGATVHELNHMDCFGTLESMRMAIRPDVK